jgi:hypothetical protein
MGPGTRTQVPATGGYAEGGGGGHSGVHTLAPATDVQTDTLNPKP